MWKYPIPFGETQTSMLRFSLNYTKVFQGEAWLWRPFKVISVHFSFVHIHLSKHKCLWCWGPHLARARWHLQLPQLPQQAAPKAVKEALRPTVLKLRSWCWDLEGWRFREMVYIYLYKILSYLKYSLLGAPDAEAKRFHVTLPSRKQPLQEWPQNIILTCNWYKNIEILSAPFLVLNLWKPVF